jgi:alkylation response protein AidB-like acyl-CoA dehydrogenase
VRSNRYNKWSLTVKAQSLYHEAGQWISYQALTDVAGAEAATRDQDGAFPVTAFKGLRQLGLVANPPLQTAQAPQLFRVLAAVGRGDLSVGRIFEGHINALLLIHLFGNLEQRAGYQRLASDGSLFGVWNTDQVDSPVILKEGYLLGKKNFASGVDGLSYAVVTASTNFGRQMAIVPVDRLPVDRSWWHPLGMRASGSHVVDFAGVAIKAESLLGAPGDYIKEPWFSAGAIRFAAVHVGGMHAVLDTAADHLRNCGRIDDPYQQHRIGKMATEVGTGYAWLDHAARYWAKIKRLEHASTTAALSAARLAIERAALNVLEIAERSVGASGMIQPHPLERLMRDLRTYLRQPNPDAALSAIGRAVAGRSWSPSE